MARKRPIKEKAKSTAFLKKSRKNGKKSSKQPETSNNFSLRSRLNLKVLDSSYFLSVPECSHAKKCPFKVFVLPGDVIQPYEKVPKMSLTPINEYGRIRKSFESFSSDEVCCWCKHCINYVRLPHLHPVDQACLSWISPTQLMRPLQRNKEEAQYWFSRDTLDVIMNALCEDDFDSVLCIGTPTLFDFLQNVSKVSQPKNAFLLDFDVRLAHFYRPSEFAQYSMLNNHFYNTESRNELMKFFEKAEKLVIVCDPPFGVFIDALMKSLASLKEICRKSSEKDELICIKVVLALPIFVGKHVLKDPSFSMVDFKVTYENHKAFSKSGSSIVRIFTDMRNNAFALPFNLGYRFCEKCDRFVAAENRHCFECAKCPSKDGSKYSHCAACSRCVKATYNHCYRCKACHLPFRHIAVL